MPVAPQTTVAEVEPKPSTDWKGQRQAPSEVHNQFVTPSVQPEPVKLVKPVPLQLESVAKPERTLAANSQSPRATTSPLSVANTPPRKIEDRNTFQPAPMRQKIVAQSPSQPREDLNGSRPVLPEDRDSFQPAPMQREMLEPTPAETVATSRPPQDFSRKLTFDPSLAKEGPAHQPPQLEEHVKERQPEYRPAPSRETVAATRPVEVVPGQSTRKPTAAGRSQLASLGKAITTGNLVTNRRSDASPTTPLSQGQPKPAATLVAARPAEIRQHNALPPIVSADSYQQDRSAQSQNASSLDATTIKAQPANATPSASGGIGLRGFVRTSEASSLPPIVSAQDHDNLKRGQ
jgi:hypothetical protein